MVLLFWPPVGEQVITTARLINGAKWERPRRPLRVNVLVGS